jgi:hypothetical protein
MGQNENLVPELLEKISLPVTKLQPDVEKNSPAATRFKERAAVICSLAKD